MPLSLTTTQEETFIFVSVFGKVNVGIYETSPLSISQLFQINLKDPSMSVLGGSENQESHLAS